MESRGPEGQLGNSGFSLGSENSVQLELSPRSLDRAAAVTNRLWPKLLNPSGHLPLPPGLPEPGQEEQTPRLNLELDGPPPGQRAQFSLGSLRPLSSRPHPSSCNFWSWFSGGDIFKAIAIKRSQGLLKTHVVPGDHR